MPSLLPCTGVSRIVAQSGNHVLVDATDFFLRDARGAAAAMESAGQGSYALDRSRSAFYMPHTKSFPENTEVETLLTFTSPKPGPLVRSVAASGEAVTLREHHSFVQLPDSGYAPRISDPRIGVFGPTFYDFAAPIDGSLTVNWVARHRLKKKNPSAARSEPVKPIVYYLDRGAPEPIRSALLDGARWWNQAFEAAGFIDAFRVEVLPEGADPMDIRYNMIHWTHRSTRGWSYGEAVIDPRTGEIIKGNVNLGSLRLRQDYLIGKGLVPQFGGAGSPSGCSLSEAPGFSYLAEVTEGADAVALALARVRQLAAHEVGHTLGFPHNYLASTYGGRASVMDYPAPMVQIRDGKLDFSDAYAVGIGEYDKLAIRWLYSDFPPGTNEAEALDAIVQSGLRSEMRFMDHTDNAIVGGAHPLASVWDNGANLVDGLLHEIEVTADRTPEFRSPGHPSRGADVAPGAGARSPLFAPPLPAERRSQQSRWSGVLLRPARRRPDADRHRSRRRTETGSRSGPRHPRARVSRHSPAHPRHDPAPRLPLRRGRDVRRAHRARVRRAERRRHRRRLHVVARLSSRADGAARRVP